MDKETNEQVKKQKYILLKNKIIDIQKDKSIYSDTSNLRLLKKQVRDNLDAKEELSNFNNLVSRNNLFDNNAKLSSNLLEDGNYFQIVKRIIRVNSQKNYPILD